MDFHKNLKSNNLCLSFTLTELEIERAYLDNSVSYLRRWIYYWRRHQLMSNLRNFTFLGKADKQNQNNLHTTLAHNCRSQCEKHVLLWLDDYSAADACPCMCLNHGATNNQVNSWNKILWNRNVGIRKPSKEAKKKQMSNKLDQLRIGTSYI